MKVLRKKYLPILTSFFLIHGITYAENLANESYDKGLEYAIQGKFTKAKEEFEKVLEYGPFLIPVKLSRKIINDVTEQKIKIEAAIHLFKGASYTGKGQFDQAIRKFTKAIKINPKYAEAYITRGITYLKTGQVGRAIQDYTSAIEINHEYANAYYYRGNAYKTNEQFHLSINDYTKAIHINSKHAPAYNNRGFIYFKVLSNKAKGCADFKKACGLGECNIYNFLIKRGDC